MKKKLKKKELEKVSGGVIPAPFVDESNSPAIQTTGDQGKEETGMTWLGNNSQSPNSSPSSKR